MKQIKDFDIEEYRHGDCFDSYRYFGAHKSVENKKEGYVFRLYAPNAQKVALIGDFNSWQGEQHLMKKNAEGVYEIFVADLPEYSLYKYQVTGADGVAINRIDPYAFFSELRPGNASKTFDINDYKWNDKKYLANRDKNYNRPVSIYEVHLGSWKKKDDDSEYSYEEIIPELVKYVVENGFTHVEFLPLLEYPYDGSWGYQASGFFSITSRYGNPRQLMMLIDALHQAGIGVIFDFVPVHFVRNSDCLINYDGTPLFEYGNLNWRYSQWDSVNFDLGKGEVISFLISSALFLADIYHIDGIRIDAVSNIIYWGGNSVIGVNQGGLSFIKRLNHSMAEKHPNVMMIAEDSSSYPNITKPTFEGGLGFDYKWDLGWMNDTLRYFNTDHTYRKFHHNLMTFSMHYFYHERFLLPLSHDEVVHMKGSIINKMSGSYEMKFDSVKALYVYQFMHPGKKLLFMGNELGEFDEWLEHRQLNWQLLSFERHRGLALFIKNLNFMYAKHPAFYQNEFQPGNFWWIKVDNSEQSLFIFCRAHQDSRIVIIVNLTPTYYEHYRFGVPWAGRYKEILNSDKKEYGGYDNYNGEDIFTNKSGMDNYPQSIGIRVAPNSGIVLRFVESEKEDV